MYLSFKDKVNYTGIESYIWEKIDNQKLDWFPISISVNEELEEI
jgi:hypothetical protein